MEFRNLFKTFFGKEKQRKITEQRIKLLNSFNPEFSTVSEKIYESKLARQAIDRIATHCSKMKPMHIKSNLNNHIKGDVDFLLNNKPNSLMTRSDFLYKIISNLYSNSNAFIFIKKDENGYITAFYPLLASEYVLFEDNEGIIYLKFKFINGQFYYIPYMELIHLRKFYNKHDIFGTNNLVLKTDLETAQTASEGIKNAIKTTNFLKGILKFSNSMLKSKDIKNSKEEFVKDFLNLENESGIAALDAKAEFQEVNLKPITLDKEQLEKVNQNVFDYFGISDKIIRNDFNEEEWNAFYEGVLEPISQQLSDAFTIKIFNDKAIKEGHKIIFSTNRIKYASLKSRVSLIKEGGALGVLTVNTVLEILDLPTIDGEDGNRIVQSLNYIDTKIANKYQGGE